MKSKELLDKLNEDYLKIHMEYENNYWLSCMGDKSFDEAFVTTKNLLENFRSDESLLQIVNEAYISESNGELQKRLGYRKMFFELYAVPEGVRGLRNDIMELEKKVESARSTRKTGYVDPHTGEFVAMTQGSMMSKIMTEGEESLRKVLNDAIQATVTDDVDDLIALVEMKNEYARQLGFKHFYDYKARIDERMNCEDIFAIMDNLRKGAQSAFDYVRELERTIPGIREPWNLGYMLAGDFIKQDDPYFQIEDSLERWGRTMMSMGIDYKGATMQLDLLEREGKLQNGFCRWPVPVYYKDGKRFPTVIGFTCDNNPNIIGEGAGMYETLFHEGGHAAHFANCTMEDVILNAEYPPTSTAWAETQSMFLDSICVDIEWRMRYAKNSEGVLYDRSIFEAKRRKLWPLAPKSIMGLCAVIQFERLLYTFDGKLTKDKVIEYAKKISDEYFDYATPVLSVLMPMHIYTRENTCAYHGYALAELAVHQARNYFYDTYGNITDNPKVGEEMAKWWNVGSSIGFEGCVKGLTGKPISADAYVKNISRTIEQTLEDARARIAKLESIPLNSDPIDIGATIKIVDGKDLICDNQISFEDMCEKFKIWIRSKKFTSQN